MNKKQILAIVLIFVFTLLISLLINLPVRHLLRFVEIQPPLQLQGLSGTISNGKIERLSYQQLSISEVKFEFQPVCLFKAAICYQFSADDKALWLNLEVNPLTRNASVKQSSVMLGSEILNDFPQLLVKPKGDFSIFIDKLSASDAGLSDLDASIDWLGAGVQGEDQQLGNYRAVISMQNDKVNINMSDQDSLLLLKGDIDVFWAGNYNVDLKFESRPGLNQSVVSVLSMATARSGLNRFSLKRSGKLDASSQKVLERLHPGL